MSEQVIEQAASELPPERKIEVGRDQAAIIIKANGDLTFVRPMELSQAMSIATCAMVFLTGTEERVGKAVELIQEEIDARVQASHRAQELIAKLFGMVGDPPEKKEGE